MKFKGEKVKKKLVLIGAGDFAEIAYEYFTFDSDYEVTGFCVEKKYLLKDELAKLPVVPYEEIEEIYPPSLYEVFVAIPNSQLNRLRRRFYDDLKSKGYRFATYVSSHAFVWRNVEIGENTVIAAQTGIAGSTKIGKNCMIGGQVGIVGHLEIADEVKIAAQSGISHNIDQVGQIVQGSPAFEIGDYKRSYVLFRALPKLKGQLDQLIKKLNSSQDE